MLPQSPSLPVLPQPPSLARAFHKLPQPPSCSPCPRCTRLSTCSPSPRHFLSPRSPLHILPRQSAMDMHLPSQRICSVTERSAPPALNDMLLSPPTIRAVTSACRVFRSPWNLSPHRNLSFHSSLLRTCHFIPALSPHACRTFESRWNRAQATDQHEPLLILVPQMVADGELGGCSSLPQSVVLEKGRSGADWVGAAAMENARHSP